MNIDWLETQKISWLDRVGQDRVPHAVILAGQPGVGKRAFAAWMAAHKLAGHDAAGDPRHPVEPVQHADLHWLAPPEDKFSIGIDQIRALVGEFSMTSYEGKGKVGVIEPANAMTTSAANSLLKTLEEPPGDSLLILVVDRTGGLPATIMSRCQRINVPTPEADVSLEWLGRYDPKSEWRDLLEFAGGAPLAAIRAREMTDLGRELASDMVAIIDGQTPALSVSGRLAAAHKADPRNVLDALAVIVQHCIRQVTTGGHAARAVNIPDSVLRRIDSRNLFCYLDIINGLRNQAPGTFNVALTFDALLTEWAGGLTTCRDSRGPEDMLPGTATG